MGMTTAETTVNGAENVRWDLSDLYPGIAAPEIQADMEIINNRLAAFDNQYRGKVAQLSAQEMLVALEEYEAIQEMVARIGIFASLNWTTDTIDPTSGKFLAEAQKNQVEYAQKLMFFQLEWRAAPEETAQLANDPLLKKYEHYLKVTRLLAPYTLSEKEERVITELSLSGATGWNRYYSEVMSRARYEFEGQDLNQGQLLKYLYSADRDQRKLAADVFTEGLHNLSHTTTFVFNMLAVQKRSVDKMRKYPSWVASRNLSNELDDEDVEALVGAVTSRYDIVQRYYRLTQKLLGHAKLYDYDRYAPILDEDWHVNWDDACEMVLDSFEKFDPQMADIATKFFEGNWIDAGILPNKRSGAFSSGTVPSAHPYILMNYTGNLRDVMTLAHEL
jgi:oligoendopeptidase F